MANQLFNQYEQRLWEQAVKLGSFTCLLNEPKLLYCWQRFHSSDVKKIAAIQCHNNSLKPESNLEHRFCKPHCDKLDKWLEQERKKFEKKLI